ncbi:acyl carrier protein [Nocardia abscessus]|uniref:acyl carrier protein n=1 Tax=Nocardia TaxID=1817 RepID=UPI0018930B37|nr:MULTISPECIES: acyl carrier protein [Nocardia]MBF6220618.1 acyl carrier protein [Nocardia abscessus]MDE1671900.1 acyl carrier protein [Nocardia gipuzkoensis]
MNESDALAQRVLAIFSRGLRTTEIDPDTPLLDYGLDSVRSVELVVELEREFEIAISDEEAAALHTAREVIVCVTAKTARVARAGARA